MGEKLYYVFKIIKEAREPISAKDILSVWKIMRFF